MNYIKYLLGAVWVTALFLQCKESNEKPAQETDKVLVTSGITENSLFMVELFASDTLFAGYNHLYLKIKDEDGGEQITAAEISWKPLMHMVGMAHSAPFENPVNLANDDDLFEGAVVFIMPSNPDEGWTLEVSIEAQGKSDKVVFTIPIVKSPKEERMVRIISEEENTVYFITLVEPSSPKVGINDLEFTVHYRESMMSFPAVENATITFEPEMPSMNHGSPNNLQPDHSTNGHYKGQVNFTMTGWWRLNVTLQKDGKVVSDSIDFNVTF